MSAHSQQLPSKSSLSITLTEPFVILRTVDAAGSQPLLGEFAPPSVLRGLLALDLSKASKISSIQIELQATSCASWSEGMSHAHSPSSLYKRFQGWAPQRSASFTVPLKSSSALHPRHLLDDPCLWSTTMLTTVNINNHVHLSTSATEAEPALPVPSPVYITARSRAHLNRPPASSPLSFPPTSEEEVIAHTPTSAHFAESPTPRFRHSTCGNLAPAYNQAPRTTEHSRTASLGETQTSRPSSRHGQSAASTSRANSLHGKGHRSSGSLGFGSIFGRGSRPASPVHDEGHPENLHSNGSERGREKSSTKRISLFPHNTLGKKGEAPRLEEEHKEVGDGWQEFRKGTYTYPISFEIPSHMPASLECDGGSVTWKLVAKVRRPGVFTPNLTATRDVHVVSLPADADLDMAGDIQIERPWDDQLQYLFKVSRKTFAIGASFNLKVVFMPLAKVRMFKFAVDIEERIDSYSTGLNLTRTVTSAIPLLKLQNDDETKPLLPLSSDDPVAYESSPLAAIRPLGANSSEVASQLLGPGPWPLRAKLHLPADCELLHPTSRSRDCAIQVSHALRFTMRLSRGDDTGVDPKTGKSKLFEIVVRTPVHILSVRYPSSSAFPSRLDLPGLIFDLSPPAVLRTC
ncbi:hypothetical protein BGY98DRAFT_1094397 [Russula aff. rugulosa BPL654]|nr:hypothetical protein BGY98DRAFT_1094397 [Russula aff. rugulosa BPL654]